MAGVEDESLTVRHGGEILQHQTELGPVGEDLPVAAVGDELLGELRHPGVQVVQQHVDEEPMLDFANVNDFVEYANRDLKTSKYV